MTRQKVVVWWHRHLDTDPESSDFRDVEEHYYVGDHTLVLECPTARHHIRIANTDNIKFIKEPTK
ncbi:hypothetical protein D3C77_34600 [compost metagenome]